MEAAGPVHAMAGTSAEHYRRLGLEPARIQVWEDGLRTDAGEGSFEWWYFDCQLEDGSKLVIEFHTKPLYVSPKAPRTPFVSLQLDRADGSRVQRAVTTAAHEFSAARACCDVHIGANHCTGDLQHYAVHVDLDGVVFDVTMTAEVPAWRPATGHAFFGDDEARYVAWLPAVPRATVRARITIDGKSEELRGVGYHDHNWGNFALRKLVDHSTSPLAIQRASHSSSSPTLS